jgi:hypothetical protein
MQCAFFHVSAELIFHLFVGFVLLVAACIRAHEVSNVRARVLFDRTVCRRLSRRCATGSDCTAFLRRRHMQEMRCSIVMLILVCIWQYAKGTAAAQRRPHTQSCDPPIVAMQLGLQQQCSCSELADR